MLSIEQIPNRTIKSNLFNKINQLIDPNVELLKDIKTNWKLQYLKVKHFLSQSLVFPLVSNSPLSLRAVEGIWLEPVPSLSNRLFWIMQRQLQRMILNLTGYWMPKIYCLKSSNSPALYTVLERKVIHAFQNTELKTSTGKLW